MLARICIATLVGRTNVLCCEPMISGAPVSKEVVQNFLSL